MANEVLKLKCTQCGSNEIRPMGIQGFNLRSIFQALGLRFLFQTNFDGPLEYKCLKCGTKMVISPQDANSTDLLEKPCIVKLTREGSFVGALVDFPVFLNGKRVGSIANKKTLEIETNVKNNLIFLTDDMAGASQNKYFIFDAISGGTIELYFSRF
jgi:DNA-directed RNA polymerase subunit RPC12/RpoP